MVTSGNVAIPESRMGQDVLGNPVLSLFVQLDSDTFLSQESLTLAVEVCIICKYCSEGIQCSCRVGYNP